LSREKVYEHILRGQKLDESQMFKSKIVCYSPLGFAHNTPVTEQLISEYAKFK